MLVGDRQEELPLFFGFLQNQGDSVNEVGFKFDLLLKIFTHSIKIRESEKLSKIYMNISTLLDFYEQLLFKMNINMNQKLELERVGGLSSPEYREISK